MGDLRQEKILAARIDNLSSLFGAMFEGNQLPMIIWDLHRLRPVAANRAADAFFGRAVAGASPYDLFPAAADVHENNLASLGAAGRKIFESEARTMRGAVPVTVITTGYADAGAPHALAIVVDRRETAFLETQLEHSSSRVEALLRALPDHACLVDSRGRVVEVLTPGAFAFEIPPAGTPLADLLPAEAVARAMRALRLALRRRTAQTEELVFEYDGRRRWVEWRAVPAGDALAQDPLCLVLLRDRTDEHDAEMEKRRLLAAIEQSANSIVITDRKGTIMYVNDTFCRTTGFTSEQAKGANSRILKSGRHSGVFYRAMWETLTAGRIWQGRLTNKKRNGELFVEDVTITPIKDPDGETLHYVAVKRDVTDDERVAERMGTAQKLAAVGQVAAGMAHEINNPLSIVLGAAQLMLEDEGLSEQQRTDLDTIVRNSQRAGAITRQMLELARGKPKNPQQADVAEIFDNVKAMMEPGFRKFGIAIELAEDGQRVYADVDQVTQILLNIALNAKDAMKEQSTPRRFRLEARTDGDETVILAQDNGGGIAAEHQARIFEAFYTTKPTGQGTGLGMSLSYNLAVDNGGLLSLEATGPAGTVFRLQLPAHKNRTTA